MAADAGHPLSLDAYLGLGRLVEPWAERILKKRLARGKEHAARWPERLGRAGADRPAGKLLWVHAASVGETAAVLPLLPRLRDEAGAELLLTTGTVTSAAFVEARLKEGMRHQFAPVDVPGAVRGFLDHWRPDLGIFVESELWPGFIGASRERGLPLTLVNGRMSDRSFRRWRHFSGFAGTLLASFEVIAAQSDDDAERFSALGAPHVISAGNLKFDGPAPPADPEALEALRTAIGTRPLFAAASTHDDEETQVLSVHQRLCQEIPGLLTLLAPRHPDRAAEVTALCEAAGLQVARRSLGQMPDAGTAVLLFDTIGELGLVYRLASVSFVGGSLVQHGGQNPLEPAKLGSAVLHGPNTQNFRDIYRRLDAADAACPVGDVDALAVAVHRFLMEPDHARAQATRASALVAESEGAGERTIAALLPLLVRSGP